jgi:hypothetical protein
MLAAAALRRRRAAGNDGGGGVAQTAMALLSFVATVAATVTLITVINPENEVVAIRPSDLLALANASSAACDGGSAAVCAARYEPVCGTDNRTYANACVLHAACARLASAGPC